jgi:hypothetical protein
LELYKNYTKWINDLDIYKPYYDGFSNENWSENFLDRHSRMELFPRLNAKYGEYLNRTDIMEILNIPKTVTKYIACRDINYHFNRSGSVWTYPLIKEYGYRIMVYSGDADEMVPTIGTWRWIEKLNWRRLSAQKEWRIDSKVVGYLHVFDGLDFLIFHGGSHLVPIWMKEESHIAIFAWINNAPFP